MSSNSATKMVVDCIRVISAVRVLIVATIGVGSMATVTAAAWGAHLFELEKPFANLIGVEEGVLDRNDPLLNVHGSLETQAGSHPFALTTTIEFSHEVTSEEEEFRENLEENEIPTGSPEVRVKTYGDPKHLKVNLPVGVVVNPDATSTKCTERQFEEKPGIGGGCPDASVVGLAIPYAGGFGENARSPVYSLVPPQGVPAEFGVNPGSVGFVFHIVGNVRTGDDYGLSAEVSDITQSATAYGARIVLWGDPTSEIHDGYRGKCAARGPVEKAIEEEYVNHNHAPPDGNLYDCPLKNAARTGKALLTMPGSCTGVPLESTLSDLYSWQESGHVLGPFRSASPAVMGCDKLHFNPSLNVRPSPEGGATESPSGLNVDLKFPQQETEGLAEANLRTVVVKLPPGFAVSPSAANGLGACPRLTGTDKTKEEQEEKKELVGINLESKQSANCPDSSKVGDAEVTTPLLEAPLRGAVYLAQQDAFEGSLIGLYLVVEGSGAVIKLAGKVELDQETGQITARFDGNRPGEGNPQLPFSDLKLKFFPGPRAPLVTPSSCGTYAVSSQLTPWSGTATVEQPSGSFSIDQGCGHGFSPSFSAGTTNLQAGAYTPFSLTLSRQDGEQRFGNIRVTMPPGLLANLKSVSQCPEPQASSGECGPDSLIGESTAAAGPGSDPFWVKGGKVYLTGPYGGAPFGLSIVVPAVAGPFNLGNVIARAAVGVDSHTAQAIVTSQIPTIKDGIPLDVRTVNVTINRVGFMFNPTDCAPSSVSAIVGSTTNNLAGVSSPFDVANCAALPFKPSFKASTPAKTSKAAGAGLKVKVGSGAGQANIAKVRVTLPKQLPARLTTLQKACTDTQFNANPAGCPAASVIGTATAITPVLAHPLTGPAYFVSHGGAAFPDVVFVLQGEGIKLYLDGNTNIKKGITTSTFNSVPDAPISSFETVIPEGPHSALATNIPAKTKGSMCQQKLTMPTTITGQNGAVVTQTTKIAVSGCPKKPKPKKGSGKRKK